MIERLIHDKLYSELSKFANAYGMQVMRARQIFDFKFPCLLIDYSDAVLDRSNTPINEIYEINVTDDIFYKRGVAIRQYIQLNIYDKDLKRIAILQYELFNFCKSLKFNEIVNVNPPKILDFVEEDFVYRRLIEIECKFVVSYEEMYKTIEKIEAETEMR